MQWEKGSPTVIEDWSSALLSLEKAILPKQKGPESSKSRSARSKLTQAASSSGFHTVPRKAACDSLSATFQPTPWKGPLSFSVGHMRSVPKKQLPIIKGRSNNPGVLMGESHNKAVDSNEPRKNILSFFTWNRSSCCHKNGGEAALAVKPLWYKVSYLRYPYQRKGGACD